MNPSIAYSGGGENWSRSGSRRRLATTGTAVAAFRVLTIPGLRNSGTGHWQTIWERAHPEYRRVNQRDWNNPDLADWSAAILRELRADDRPAILVAHSFGCLAAVHSAAHAGGRIAAAMLVAPANPARFDIAHELSSDVLPFPSVLVASASDPWLAFDVARGLAARWGSNLVNLGNAGHINAESGHGAWPEGERFLFELQRLVGTERRATS